jgi:hypothetical protein
LVHRHGRAAGNLIGNCVATEVIAARDGDLDHVRAAQVLEGQRRVPKEPLVEIPSH